MGIVDIVPLYDIYKEAIRLEKKHNWGFQFKVDEGCFETGIEFFETEIGIVTHHPPISDSWTAAQIIQCPDILDFTNRIIIEYEEETGNRRSGARMAKKGHGHPGELTNKRDSSRDSNYRRGGFRVLKIWETEYLEEKWNKKLYKFLCDCFCNRLEPKISTPGIN